jgi:hypothetical protein
MASLSTIIDDINDEIVSMNGKEVKSILSVCNAIREHVCNSDLFRRLEDKGLSDLLVFRNDDISTIDTIFIKLANDTYKGIIHISVDVDFYDTSDLSMGGILRSVKCEFTDVGDKFKDVPLEQLVNYFQLISFKTTVSDLNKKIEAEEQELKEFVERKQKEIDEMKKERDNLNEKYKDVETDLKQDM